MDEAKEKSGKRDFLIAMLLLLPVFPVIPLFLLGIWAGNLENKLQIESRIYSDKAWIMLIAFCIAIVVLYPDFNYPLKFDNGWFFFGLIAASGLLTGYLFSDLKKSKWVSVLPLFIASFVCFMRFVMEFAAGQTA